MKLMLAIILLITVSATPVKELSAHRYLIVWNVGQGQWVTALQEQACLHFDLGGEFFPWKKLAVLCQKNQNKFFLSHWDWDHIGALPRWPRWSACIASAPIGASTTRKMKILKAFSPCANSSQQEVQTWTPQESKDSNAESKVSEYQNFLLPGDSPLEQEKTWMNQSWTWSTRVLILGHHGSRTSTSEELLRHLPQLKMAVASARWSRYHHPHSDTLARLMKHHIAILKTEDWGNIWFEL